MGWKIQIIILFILTLSNTYFSQNSDSMYFSFNIGDKWFYTGYINYFPKILTKEIVGKEGNKFTVLSTLKSEHYNEQKTEYWEVIDHNFYISSSLYTNPIYIYNLASDTTYIDSLNYVYYKTCSLKNIADTLWRTSSAQEFHYYEKDGHTNRSDIVIRTAPEVGIYYYSWASNSGSEYNSLVGLISNGIVIGDTTLITSVIDFPPPSKSYFNLFQCYPNPFNPVTVISYQLLVTNHTLLKVYDVLGNEVSTLVNEKKAPGYYQVNFDGSNLTSGFYLYRIIIGNYSDTKKMILLK